MKKVLEKKKTALDQTENKLWDIKDLENKD